MSQKTPLTGSGQHWTADFGVFHNISDDSYKRGFAHGCTEGEKAGYAAGEKTGYSAGHTAGQQAEYDRFWDAFQQNGNKTDYYYTFAGKGWNDDTFNPKYPIVASSRTNAGQGMFYECDGITRIPVPIEVARGVSIQAMFSACRKLHTITLLKLGGDNHITTNSFNGLYVLKNITFDGYIEKSVTFPQSSNLTDTSVQNIIDHLADLTGKTAQTLTFHAEVGARLTDAQKATVTAKNWTLVY